MTALPIPDDHGQHASEAQRPAAVVVPFAPGPASVRPTPMAVALAGGNVPPQDPARKPPKPTRHAPDPAMFDQLRILADSFEDAQRSRIQIENRLRSGTVPTAPVEEALDSLRHAEKKLGLAMRRSFRAAAPDVYAWVKDTPGVGEHLMARLLGVIGHPVYAYPHHWEGDGAERTLVADEPFARSVSQLWSYCGHGDPGRKKRKGMTADEAFALGSPRAKMIVHLLAESAMKCVGSGSIFAADPRTIRDPAGAVPPIEPSDSPLSITSAAHGEPLSDDAPVPDPTPKSVAVRRRSPYRDVYEHARRRYADRDWTPAHQHNAALRLVGKHLLRDLWIAAHPKENR